MSSISADAAWVRSTTPSARVYFAFDPAPAEVVVGVVVDVLSSTTPGTTKAGTPSKASYVLGDGVAAKVKDASAEMLDKHPLYPGLELS